MLNTPAYISRLILLSLLVSSIAVILAIISQNTLRTSVRNLLPTLHWSEGSFTTMTTYPRGHVYFISHGGPPTMFDHESKAYKTWGKIGKLLENDQPRGLIVVSAHWENPNETSDVLINVDKSNPLYYDFYGFPPKYYQVKFNSHGDDQMIQAVKDALGESKIGAKGVMRGLDHGVFVPFVVAFPSGTDIPIVQVSLPGDSSPVSTAKLGKALSKLRDQGYTVIGTGQVIHNIRDLLSGRPQPYAKPFLQAVTSALASKDSVNDTINLLRHPLFRSAHPSDEHFLPLVFAVGATNQGDKLENLLVETEGGWGMWRWV